MNVNPKYIFFLFYVLGYDYPDIISIQYMFPYQFNFSRPCDSIVEVKFSSRHIRHALTYKQMDRNFLQTRSKEIFYKPASKSETHFRFLGLSLGKQTLIGYLETKLKLRKKIAKT
jgi:hypothetical protein